jgi:hypothetical protein
MNYSKLMALQPTHYGTMTNSIGQVIDFYEHPIHGDETPVVAVSHLDKLAASTDFYELDDMVADHGEYEPLFIDGKFQHGE